MNVSPTWTTPKESGRHIAAPINECDCNVPALGYIRVEKMRCNTIVRNALVNDKPGTHHMKIGLLQSHNLKRRNRCIYGSICHGGGHRTTQIETTYALRPFGECMLQFTVSASVANRE